MRQRALGEIHCVSKRYFGATRAALRQTCSGCLRKVTCLLVDLDFNSFIPEA
jgi:hypothetical protein